MMETYQIASWLRDKAVRSGNHSWERVMMMAAARLEQQEKQLEMARAERKIVTERMIELEIERGKSDLDLSPQIYPEGFQPAGMLFAKACPTCKNARTDKCRKCKMEVESGYAPKASSGEKCKAGRWLVRITSDDIWAECSECAAHGNPWLKECPVCGARMVVEE